MATSAGRKTWEAGTVTDPELWRDQQRFYNFLQHYDLHKYHQRFSKMGVLRLNHFKDVTDADLDAVGLTPPEKTRLRKKLEENFSKKGKIMVRDLATTTVGFGGCRAPAIKEFVKVANVFQSRKDFVLPPLLSIYGFYCAFTLERPLLERA